MITTECTCEWAPGEDVLVATHEGTELRIPGAMLEPLKDALDKKGAADREVFRKALADIYNWRSDHQLHDHGMAVEWATERASRALFVDTTPPVEGYPAR